MKSIEARALEWAVGRDTGSSSNALCAFLSGVRPKGHIDYPVDGDDLGRCMRLLDLIPEWKPRIGEMKAANPQWAALADNWDELTKLHKAENYEATYKKMKAILRGPEAKDPNLIRMGENVSIRFGR